jgi:hypothetical protein
MGGFQTTATLTFNDAEYQRINTWLRNRSGMIFLDNKKESLMRKKSKNFKSLPKYTKIIILSINLEKFAINI